MRHNDFLIPAIDLFKRTFLYAFSRRPGFYAWSYIAIIIVFTVIFINLPEGFYAPDSHLESGWKVSSSNIEINISDEIINNARTKLNRITAVDGFSSNQIGKVATPNFRVSDGGAIILTAYGRFPERELKYDRPVGGIPFLYFKCDISIDLTDISDLPLRRYPNHINFTDLPGHFLVFFNYGQGCPQEEVERIFDTYEGGLLISFSQKSTTEARNLIKGFYGDPDSVSGNLFRMLYLSVVVITTLGLGEIVPTSSVARLSVGLEALLGVITIGLFLNSISSRRPS